MILTESGEIGVHTESGDYILRPSLYAMSTLGSPSEIVGIFACVMTDGLEGKAKEWQIGDAISVIYACSDDDLSDVFGYFDETLSFVPGTAPVDHILHLARCLLKHGITGAQDPLPRGADEEPEYLREFKAADHVSLAMAHLGLSEKEAWSLTMTGLIGAMRAKFPRPDNAPGNNAPSKEQHEKTMEWFDRISEKRNKRSKK